MTCATAIELLRANRSKLSRFPVKSLAIFGSVARNEAADTSDVDILVEFSGALGLFRFAELRLLLSEILGREVDLATVDSLRPEIRQRVLAEAVRAA